VSRPLNARCYQGHRQAATVAKAVSRLLLTGEVRARAGVRSCVNQYVSNVEWSKGAYGGAV
jgi:hypothetical protein